MSYLNLINQYWKLNMKYCFTACETQLYFKLLDICNKFGWRDSFYASNMHICAETGMSERTLIQVRNKLQELGLIEFISGKRRREVTQYHIELGYTETCEHFSQDDSQHFSQDHSQYFSQEGKNDSDNIRTIDEDIDKDIEDREDKSSLSTCVDSRVPVAKIVDEYNRLCFKLPKATAKTKTRGAAVRARIKEHGFEAVMRMLKIASESDFLAGSNKSNWVASFDWLFKPANFVKVLEGNYNNRPSQERKLSNEAIDNGSKNYFKNKPSPLQLIEEAYNNIVSNGSFNS